MCGIIGYVSLTKLSTWQAKEEFLRRGLFVDTLRGFDSTGIFCVPHDAADKEPLVYKRAVPGTDFIYLKKANKLIRNADKYFAVIGHNRAATQGAINNETAHPFTYDHITMVHNGTLSSRHGLSGTGTFAVDSEDICHALSQTDDPKKVLEKLHGAYALIWYNAKEQCLYVTRNKDRPLFFALSEDKNNMFFASEDWMLDASVDYVFKVHQSYLLKPHVIMRIPVGLNKLSDYEIEEYKEYIPPVKPLSNGYGGYGGDYSHASTTLNEYGYYYRERIKFKIEEVRVYRTNAPQAVGGTCTLIGNTVPVNGYPSDATVSYQVPLERLTKNMKTSELDLLQELKQRTFIGEAIYATHVAGRVELKLDSIMEFVPGKQPEPEDVNLDREYKNNDEVMGPDNKPITVKKFKKLVENGCAYCTGNIFPHEAEEVLWTQDDTPICPVCSEFYTEWAGEDDLQMH